MLDLLLLRLLSLWEARRQVRTQGAYVRTYKNVTGDGLTREDVVAAYAAAVAAGGRAGAAASTLLGGVLNVGPFGLIPSLPAVGSGTNLAEGFAQACGEDLGGEGVPEEGQRPNPNPGTLPGPLLRLLVSAKVRVPPPF